MKRLLSPGLIIIFLLFFHSVTARGEPTWQRTNGPEAAASICEIVFHPTDNSIAYAGTNRGIYKTTDEGENWFELAAGIPTDSTIGDVAIDWQNPNYLYARTERTLYRSTDGGNSWSVCDLSPQGEGWYRMRGLVTDPNQPGVVFQLGYFEHYGKFDIWKSEDYGATWSVLYSEGPSDELSYFFTDLYISHFDSNTMWVKLSPRWDDNPEFRSLHVTHDGGLTWSPYGAYDPLEGSGVRAMALHPHDSLTMYLSGANYPNLLYRTKDDGGSWELILSEPNADFAINGIYVDSDDPGLIYTTGWGGFLVSENAGETWEYLDGNNLEGVDTDLHVMAVCPLDRNLIFLGGLGGILKSVNGGMNFSKVNRGLRSCKLRCVKVNPYNPDEVHTLAFKGYGMYKTTDGGESWFQSRWSRVSLCSMLIDISKTDPDVVYVTGGGAFRCTDGGVIWEHMNNQFRNSHAHGVVIDPFDQNIIYVGIGADRTNPQGDGLYRTTDGGESWENIDEGLADRVHVSEIRVDPTNPRIVYHSTRGEMMTFDVPYGPGKGIYKSTNRGEEWFPINNGLTNLSIHSMVINPYDPDILYACTEADWELGGNEGVFKSTNGGESWFPAGNGLPPSRDDFFLNLHTMVIDPANPEVLYVGRLNSVLDQYNPSGNIYKTTNGGESWFEFDEGLTPPSSDNVTGIEYMDIDPTGSILYCGTWDSGIYKLGSVPDIDTLPPVLIAGPALFDFHPLSVTVRWKTHEPSTSVLEYGFSTSYGQSVESDSLTLHHEVILTELDPDATYHFRVGSTDALGNGPRWSKDFTFTLSESDFEKPEFLEVTDLKNATGTGPFRIEAEVTDNYGVEEVRLLYSCDNGETYQDAVMDRNYDTSFSYDITASPGTEYVDYYFQAQDYSGNLARRPDNAPMNTYAFSITEREMSPFLYVSLVDHGTMEVNLETGLGSQAFDFEVGQWVPYANDSLMVGVRREGIKIAETATNQVVGELDYPNGSQDCPWALHALISPDDRYLYMEKWEYTDTVAVIDLETLGFEKFLTTGDPGRMINGMVLSGDGRYLYVSTSLAYVPASTKSTGPFRYDDYVKNIGELRSSSQKACGSESGTGYIHVIDVETGEIISVIRMGVISGGVDFSREFEYLYATAITDDNQRKIYRIDSTTNTVVDSSEFGHGGGPPTPFVTRWHQGFTFMS
ncbi:MAG: fibronectin type III domain-containing protein [Candidatus Glassbacteria bacterium]